VDNDVAVAIIATDPAVAPGTVEAHRRLTDSAEEQLTRRTVELGRGSLTDSAEEQLTRRTVELGRGSRVVIGIRNACGEQDDIAVGAITPQIEIAVVIKLNAPLAILRSED